MTVAIPAVMSQQWSRRMPGLRTGRRLTYHSSEQWSEAYDIATTKLSKDECEWLETTRRSDNRAYLPIRIAEEARQQMVDKQWMSTEVRDAFEKILTRIDKYAKIVDVAIQHHPDITYVYHANIRSRL